jgi:hypothetical protein
MRVSLNLVPAAKRDRRTTGLAPPSLSRRALNTELVCSVLNVQVFAFGIVHKLPFFSAADAAQFSFLLRLISNNEDEKNSFQ